MKKSSFLSFLVAILALTLAGCGKDNDNTPQADELLVYQLTDVANAAVQGAKSGIDLSNGRLYTVIEGRQHQNDIDIAYGYMTKDEIYTRCFLSLSYAGCFCGGSSYFSYGDQTGGGNKQGYASYSVLNDTKLQPGPSNIDFDAIAAAKTKNALLAVFPADGRTSDELFFADRNDNLTTPYTLFTTAKGKRGIIRVKPYTKNTAQQYNLQENKITIDVIVEK